MSLFRCLILVGSVLLTSAAHAGAAGADPQAAGAVQACYEGYKKAVEGKDGAQALTFISAKSVQYYGDMLSKALYGDGKALEPLTLADKYLVLSVRHRLPAEKAVALTGESLYVMSASKGWFGVASTQQRSLDVVEMVSADKARAVQLMAGAKTDEVATFSKEGGVWKIDLDYQTAIINAMLSKALKESGLPEKAFFTQILGVATNQRVAPTLWEPMIAQPSESAAK